MAITLPLPLRVAAGLLATGIDLVKSLPEDIPAIPVTLVGNAMRLSMKFQQEITTLATRGDELLGGVIGAPEENPAWAKFDDDEPVRPAPARPKAGPVSDRKPSAAEKPGTSSASKTTITPETVSKPKRSPESSGLGAAAAGNSGEHELKTPTATATAPADTTAMEAALEVSEALVEQALAVADPDTAAGTENAEETQSEGATDARPIDVAPAEVETGVTELDAAADEPELPIAVDPVGSVDDDLDQAIESAAQIDAAGGGEQDGPAALPGYGSMTLAQVRGHLRELTADDVGVLLRYEQGGDNRPPFLTLLSNRLVTLDAQNQ